ncbi:DUF5667 domain-containing protein [Patescibacteria group bacterium AH-259-L05]|nr:DUF5667 domain-containing protein [Patescibacteria group bacterium AH-259-L05]
MTKTKYIIIILAALGLVATPFLNIKAQDTATGEDAALSSELSPSGDSAPAELDTDTIQKSPATESEPIVDEESVDVSLEQPAIEDAFDPAEPTGAPEEVFEDENITFEDLEINDPRLLPTSPYYPIKNIWRGFRTTFTFDPIRKAKLKLRFADERLFEAKKVAERGDKPKIVTEALERYEKEFSSVSDLLKQAPEERKEEIKRFADKIIDHSFKQQRLIDGIEKRLDPEHFEKINKVRENGIKHFAQAITNFTPPEEIHEKITNVIEKQRGSNFKHFKNLEVLKAVEEKVPEAARDAIRQAQDNALKRLQEKMTEIDEEERERFKDYVDNIGGNEVRHLEILSDFTTREIPDIIREEMEHAKEKAFLRIEEKMKKFTREEEKREFLKHLEGGEMEDLRIIKELENNLAPETIDKVLEIKNKAMDNFRRDFEAATTPETQDKFFDKIEEFHDVKQFEVFKEIEKIIPEDKKEFFEKMKAKAIEEMKRDVEGARDERHRAEIFERLAGDAPEHFEIISEFAPPPEIIEGLFRYQTDRLRERIEAIEDPDRLHFFEQRIAGEEGIRAEIERRAPEILGRLEQRVGEKLREIDVEMVVHKIDRAFEKLTDIEEDIRDIEAEDPDLFEDLQHSPVFTLLEGVRTHIDNAETALDEEQFGKAFGQANSALHQLRNIFRIIGGIELEFEIAHERLEEMEEMMELQEEFMRELEEEMIEGEEELQEEFMEELMEKKLRMMEEMREDEEDQEFEERERELFRKDKRRMMESIIQERTRPEEAEFEFRFEQEFFPEEKRSGFEEVIEQLPSHVQNQLQNLPPDMVPQALDRLKIKIEHRERPLPPLEGEEEVLPPGLLGPPIEIEPPFFEKPLETIRKDIPEAIKRRLRIEKEEPGVTCYLWSFDAEGCKRKGGEVIFSDPDENGCEPPPKCILPDDIEPIIKPIHETIPKPVICIQVITPAKNPKTGECKNFPTPCDVPEHWETVDRCEDIKPLEHDRLRKEQLIDEERLREERLKDERREQENLRLEQLRIEEDFLRKEQERLKNLEDEKAREDKLLEEQRQKELENQIREPLGEPIESGVKPIPEKTFEPIKIEPTTTLEPTPIIKPEPIIKPTPVFKPTPIIKPEPIIKPTPVFKPTPIIKPEPIIKPTPVFKPTPIIKPEPIIKPTPVFKPTPIIKPEPIIKPTPVFKPTPLPVIEEPAPVFEEPIREPSFEEPSAIFPSSSGGIFERIKNLFR